MIHRVFTRFLTPSRAISNQLVILLVLSSIAVGQNSPVLSLEARISLPNVKGRIDHSSVDLKMQRVFVAAVENHTVEVIDLRSGQRIHTITNLAEPQGVFYEPSSNRLFVACGLDGVTKVFDGSTFQVLATTKFPDDADNIRYDERSKAIIVGYAGAKQLRKRLEGTGGLGFLDLEGKKTGDIIVDAHPESFQLERFGTRLFVNVPEKKEIEVIDVAKHSVLARWPVTAGENNFPMALDEAGHRLFVGCWKPPQLVVIDTETGKQVATGEIAGSTDDLFYDSSRHLIYVLTSKGFLEVFEQKADHYNLIAHYPTPPRSATGLFVQEWGKLLLAVPAQGEASAEVRVYQVH